MASKRPKIPEDVKLKLWVLSCGRCEFPGCNKQVWKDGLTLKEDNFAHMAHLVASSPNGPRGDKKLSPQLATDFSNLMLVCFTHSKLVDGKHKSEYTLDMLRDYKARHEERIRIQTAIGPDMATTVLRFVANIRERKMSILSAQAYDAIAPRFPSDEKGISIDYSNRANGSGSNFWKSSAHDMDEKIKSALVTGNNHESVEHLSVFGIAPIPLLIYLGNRIGGTTPTDIYQKHRDTDNWKWLKEPRSISFNYIVKKGGAKNKVKQVALFLSLSGTIDRKEAAKILPTGTPWYEITIATPDRDHLKYRSQLSLFSETYRSVLTEIRSRHGGDCEIWLFPAIPVSVAIACGRELLPKSDPHVVVYDNANEQGGFVRTLRIN